MKIAEWYLDKVTSQIPGRLEKEKVREELGEHLEEHAEILMERGMPKEIAWREAVAAMGSSDELASSMGRIHAYDTNAAFIRMIGILWLGWLLRNFRVGTETIRQLWLWGAGAFILIPLFRLRRINRDMNRAFLGSYVSFLCGFFLCAVNGLMWEQARVIGRMLMMTVQVAAGAVSIFCMAQGLGEILDERGARILSIYGLIEIGLCIGSAVGIFFGVLHGDTDWNLNIQVSGLTGVIVVVGLLIWMITELVYSWRVKGWLQENETVGIEPFCVRETVRYAVGIAAAAILPFLIAALMSVWPVFGGAYIGAQEQEAQAWEQIWERICADNTEILQETGQSETIGRLGRGLPAEELLLLKDAKSIQIRHTESDDCWDTILLFAKLSEGDGEDRYRIGCMTSYEAPFSGYTAISSIWTAGYTFDLEYGSFDRVQVKEEGRPMYSYYPILGDGEYRLFLLYEKDGRLQSFEPRYQVAADAMSAAEYTLDRKADRVYCYQAMSVTAWERMPGDGGEIEVGYENAMQTSLFRLPYEMVQYQWSYPYKDLNTLFSMEQMFNGESREGANDIVFQNGSIGEEENMNWRKKGYREVFLYE